MDILGCVRQFRHFKTRLKDEVSERFSNDNEMLETLLTCPFDCTLHEHVDNNKPASPHMVLALVGSSSGTVSSSTALECLL